MVEKPTIDTVARAICREQCAFHGERPCFELPGEWPNRNCDEPGCHALAVAVADAFCHLPPQGDST